MSDNLTAILREIHRLRRHLRELNNELDQLPFTMKAMQAKVARQEQALKNAQDEIKKRKVQIHEKEVALKASNQLLAKYERQLNDMTSPKEVEAKQTEIANTRAIIAQTEDDILTGMGQLDEQNAELPKFEALVAQARDQARQFEAEMADRRGRLQKEAELADAELKKNEAKLPAAVKSQYDRLVKAHGPDALAGVKDRTCCHCHQSVTAEQVSELTMFRLVCCPSCGRLLYPHRLRP